MNRRSFVGSLFASAGAVLLFPFTGKPRVPDYVLEHGNATGYLTYHYNKFTKGSGVSEHPREMKLGSALFDMFESEITCVQRYTDNSMDPMAERRLAFKTVRVTRSKELGNWFLQIQNPRRMVIVGSIYD